MCAPFWPSADWFHIVSSLADEKVKYRAGKLLKLPGVNDAPGRLSSWPIMIFRIPGLASGGPLPPPPSPPPVVKPSMTEGTLVLPGSLDATPPGERWLSARSCAAAPPAAPMPSTSTKSSTKSLTKAVGPLQAADELAAGAEGFDASFLSCPSPSSPDKRLFERGATRCVNGGAAPAIPQSRTGELVASYDATMTLGGRGGGRDAEGKFAEVMSSLSESRCGLLPDIMEAEPAELC